MSKLRVLDLSLASPTAIIHMTHSTGTHIILDGRDCRIDFSALDIPSIEQYISTLLRDTGMTILGTLFHDFREPS
jgi:hypothetical protein